MGLRWNLFCRVVDNFGDIGVCWRLAAELAARGHHVRLVVDDASALAWLAPRGVDGVTVVAWAEVERDAVPASVAGGCLRSDPGANDLDVEGTKAELPDVLVEAFGCTLPASVSTRVFAVAKPPVWINLEYLTAEPYAEDAHGLASPQFDAAKHRVDKWFFFPGFGEGGGGLIREANLEARQNAFSPVDWLEVHGVARRAGERVVSLFCYENERFDELLHALAQPEAPPTLLLATAGRATRQLADRLGPSMQRGTLRVVALPWLAQMDYDHLLWSCDVNLVRGEDSFVRAQWAGVPFLWQAYPQHDGIHAAKVAAFLARMSPPTDVSDLFEGWNGFGAASTRPVKWPDESRWRDHAKAWQQQLASQPDLVSRLIAFVAGKR